ncbi:AI-2E family transporter [Flavobacteriaceae bacterium]|jgi:predicted PurR-regulated permease PerM|uniref:AI-2E family transporter n=1 Tax=Candidatus Arcticimaribacter forsetii TaxID=2820661 RepID=UPI002077070C|nr:AI-2E family transporter [Candidatus Arcticimaribacter forsetii]MDA8640273.1 AI-2E family transporter [Flavobacteriaceae bacterium]MDA8699345.1 AI-2E family transporter [Flavobacteriaceae bacterium]MDB2329738.1 AI-2E family transporter [Flavobacteriaceae bacterium]MDB2345457.1 AI-2E family transporter [Flavobacteriaceae bacterium]MDB2457174.1 AI-2E family transporter [Flavobacteriaceae bacterium]
MNSKIISQGILRSILILASVLLLTYITYLLQALIVYIVIAAIISLMGRPILDFLKVKLKFNNSVATLITMFVFGLLIFGLFALFIPIIAQQGENLSLLNTTELEKNTLLLINQISEYFSLNEEYWKNWISNQDLSSKLNLSVIPNFLNTLIGWLSSFTIGLFSVLFISFFLLKDEALLQNITFSFVKNKYENKLKKSLAKIRKLLSRYFIGLLLQVTILLLIYSIVLLIFGIENAFIIAFICALLNLIPYVGPLIAAFMMVALSMSSNITEDFSTVILPKSIYVFLGFVIGQLIDNFISQPIIFSKSVKSHPLEIFIVILIAGILFGTTGLIFAIPIYTAIKVIFKEFFAQYKIVQSLTKDL